MIENVTLERCFLITQNEEVHCMINEIHQSNESSKIEKHLPVLLGNHETIHVFIQINNGNLSIAQSRSGSIVVSVLKLNVHVVTINLCVSQFTNCFIQELDASVC